MAISWNQQSKNDVKTSKIEVTLLLPGSCWFSSRVFHLKYDYFMGKIKRCCRYGKPRSLVPTPHLRLNGPGSAAGSLVRECAAQYQELYNLAVSLGFLRKQSEGYHFKWRHFYLQRTKDPYQVYYFSGWSLADLAWHYCRAAKVIIQ